MSAGKTNSELYAARERRREHNCTLWGAIIATAIVAAIGLMAVDWATAAERGTATSGVAYDLIRSGQFVRRGLADATACDIAMRDERLRYAATKTSGSERWVCRQDRWTTVSYGPGPTVVCQPAPAPRTLTCPTGSTGQWVQSATVGPAPTCAVTWAPSAAPTGACTPSGTAALSWSHDGANVTGFNLYHWRAGEIALTQSASASARSASLRNLPAGTWTFTVAAVNCPPDGARCSESARSNEVSKVVQ